MASIITVLQLLRFLERNHKRLTGLELDHVYSFHMPLYLFCLYLSYLLFAKADIIDSP